MPTYEYLCQKCGQTFEVFQSMTDAPLKVCTCGKRGKVKRLLGKGAGIIFKGSGFYETDYRRSGRKAEAAKSDAADSGKSGAPAPATPPAKPAAPPAPKK